VAPLSRTSHCAKACANGCSNTCTSTGVARYRATDGAAGGATRCATQWSRRGRRRTRSLAGISCTPFRFGLGQSGAARGDKSECDRNKNAESHKYLLARSIQYLRVWVSKTSTAFAPAFSLKACDLAATIQKIL